MLGVLRHAAVRDLVARELLLPLSEVPVTTLTQKVIDYQRTGEGLARLIGEISTVVYEFPRTQSGFTDEDGAELLLRFLPRINRLITRYRETGQSFDSYLAATLRWQLKTLAANRSRARIRLIALAGKDGELERAQRMRETLEVRESACPQAPVRRSSATHSLPDESGCDTRSHQGKALSSGQGRRLIHLSLKMTERLDETAYRRVAAATGVDPEWLLGCWHALRDSCEAQRRRRSEYEARRDGAWFRVRCIQHRLRLQLDETEHETLHRQLSMWRRRHQNALRTLARMHHGPSHAEIARVLGVPKGTVDSGIFYGKREITNPSYRAIVASVLANA